MLGCGVAPRHMFIKMFMYIIDMTRIFYASLMRALLAFDRSQRALLLL